MDTGEEQVGGGRADWQRLSCSDQAPALGHQLLVPLDRYRPDKLRHTGHPERERLRCDDDLQHPQGGPVNP